MENSPKRRPGRPRRNPDKPVCTLTIRLSVDIREKLNSIAESRYQTVTGMLHQMFAKIVADANEGRVQ